MAEAAVQRVSVAEYLAMERQAATKSEYFNGQVFAMAGAKPPHNVIVFNTTVALGRQLGGGPCRGYSSDQRLVVPETGLRTYPDISVVCGEPEFDEEDEDAITNPTLIVEVLSPSTEAYDRGDKFAHYHSLPSLQEYVLIAQDRPRIEHYVRGESGHWDYSSQPLGPVARLGALANDLKATMRLPSIDCDLRLAEVYDQIEFPADLPLRPV
jgi:Uma2 family endonuclease